MAGRVPEWHFPPSLLQRIAIVGPGMDQVPVGQEVRVRLGQADEIGIVLLDDVRDHPPCRRRAAPPGDVPEHDPDRRRATFPFLHHAVR